MRRSVRSAIAGLTVFAGTLAAQDDAARLAADASKRLFAFGQQCEHAGFPLWARRVWWEIVQEYAPDDDKARAALGQLRVGTSWAPDTRVVVPVAETGEPGKRRGLQRKWQGLAKTLAEDHLRVARKLADAAARPHFERALRFAPDCAEAGAALGWQLYDGVWCDAGELEALRRSRHIRQVVAALKRTAFAVEELPADARNEHLARAGVAHRGVRSAHYTVWGDVDVGQLRDAAQWAERALALARTVFARERGFYEQPTSVTEFAFVRELDTWKRVIERSRELLDARQVEFLLAHCLAADLPGRTTTYAAVAETADHAFDHTVRQVAIDLAVLHAEAFREGIGHAFVGWCFGRNLVYLVDLEAEKVATGRTVVARTDAGTDAPALPADMSSWLQRGMNNAWTSAGAPFAELPLLDIERMTIDDRINAWSVCDFLLRRRPAWLRALDDTDGAAAASEVASEFARLVRDVSLPAVELEWRRWWMQEERLWGTAVNGREARPEREQRDNAALLDAINAVRQRHEFGWLGWQPAAAEGPLVGRRGSRPEELVAAWLDMPGYSHALLDPSLDMLGLPSGSKDWAIDIGREDRDPEAAPRALPIDAATGTRTVRVATVPGLAAVLARDGHGESTTIGAPLTLHVRGRDSIEDVTCQVTAGGEPVAGILVGPSAEAPRALQAPGLVSFWPLTPLRPGVVVEIKWQWRSGDRQRQVISGW